MKVNYLYAKSSVKNFVTFSHCRRELGNSKLSPFHLKQIDYQRNVISPAMRCPTPMELFLLRSQVVGAHKIPGTDEGPYATAWLKDLGWQNDEKMSFEAACLFAVLSDIFQPSCLLHKTPIFKSVPIPTLPSVKL